MLPANILSALLLFFATSSRAARPLHQQTPQDAPSLVLPPGFVPTFGQEEPAEDLGERVFTLRHIYHHGAHKYPRLHRYQDIAPDASLQVSYDYGETYESAPSELRARASSMRIERLAERQKSDIDDLLAHASYFGHAATVPASAWTVDKLPGPNVTDKDTIITFAKMAANAYVQEHNADKWMPVKGGFNYTDDFGWQKDGLRGHIFADETNATVVIGLKGTSPAIFDGADTTGNDKLNDNLFGSCCCADSRAGHYTWKQVCDCMTETYTCNNTCLVKSLRKKGHYYWAVRDLYHNVTERYPDAQVWLSGHSLGGVVSSLLGLTYGLPTLTFEAFPDALGANRLGLPAPPGYKIGSHQARPETGIHHFGHTADPIYMGTCNGATSLCSIAGYAFEGVCHTGKTCIYDTMEDLGWRSGVGTHKIVNVIRDVLKKYDTVPKCQEDVDCSDCYNWKFFDSNHSDPITSTTTSSSTTTHTRTETCKTPGWWGCKDESTTTTATTLTTTLSLPTTTSVITTTSTSTSTCKTPGWFGCKDETTSASPTTTTTSTTTSSTTTTCEKPGWFGCKDEEPTSAMPVPGIAPSTPTPTTPAQHPPPPDTDRNCLRRHWYGACKEWEEPPPKSDL